MREIAASRDDATAADLTRRFHWIDKKHDAVDRRHEMITDKPAVWQDGKQRAYGSLADDARRRLTDDEMCKKFM